MPYRIVFGLLLSALVVGLFAAQEQLTLPDELDCSPEQMAALYDEFTTGITIDFEADALTARANLFQLGSMYQELALRCRYLPDDAQLDAMIERTLLVADIPRIVSVTAVGTDVEAVLAELDTTYGDSFNGQLLYNGLELGLDGAPLGCVGCHSTETAPLTEGTWTRINDVRLQQDEFADYTVRQYLVESILHPEAYIDPAYQPVMAPNYGLRLDLQQLADIVAYLESQDQELTESQ